MAKVSLNANKTVATKPKTTILVTSAQKRVDAIIPKLEKRLQRTLTKIISLPLIELFPTKDWYEFDNTTKNLPYVDAIILTSQYAVELFFQRLKTLEINKANLRDKQWIAIGEQTRAKIKKESFISLMPPIQNTTGLIKFLGSMYLEKKNFWFPCSNLAGIEFKEFLEKKKAKLMQQTIYYNRIPKGSETAMSHYLKNEPPDWMLFSSPSTFRHLLSISDKQNLKFNGKIAALGETTAEFIHEKGYKVHKIIQEKNILKLVCSIIDKEN